MSDRIRVRVRAGEGGAVGDLLVRHGDPTAAAEGRAFVNGRRAGALDPVAAGDELATWAARESPKGAEEARVLLQVGGLVVAHKPAALPTTPDRRGDRSLTSELERLLGVAAGAVHAASRLDVGVSGVVLCALGPQANKHVADMRAGGWLRRVYLGLAGGVLEGEGAWDAPIGHTQGPSGRSRPTAGGRDQEAALTRYRALGGARAAQGARGTGTTLARFEPTTGRMHQLRVHAAAAGAPLLGDREHGGARTVVHPTGRVEALSRVALHASVVELPGEHGEALRVASPVPEDLRALWRALGGDDAAWDREAKPG